MRGEGGRATGWNIRVKDANGMRYTFFEPESIEILMDGNTALDTLVASLEFVVKELRRAQVELKDDR